MAHVSDIRTVGSSAGVQHLINRFAELRATLSTRLEQNRKFRQTVSELSALSRRELSDLGIHPSNIRAIASEAAYS